MLPGSAVRLELLPVTLPTGLRELFNARVNQVLFPLDLNKPSIALVSEKGRGNATF